MHLFFDWQSFRRWNWSFKYPSSNNAFDVSYYNRNYTHLVGYGCQLFPTFQHWHSFSSAKQKLAIVISAFYRITRACNHWRNVVVAAYQIARELQHLQYPHRILLSAAGRLASADARWATIEGAWRTSDIRRRTASFFFWKCLKASWRKWWLTEHRPG